MHHSRSEPLFCGKNRSTFPARRLLPRLSVFAALLRDPAFPNLRGFSPPRCRDSSRTARVHLAHRDSRSPRRRGRQIYKPGILWQEDWTCSTKCGRMVSAACIVREHVQARAKGTHNPLAHFLSIAYCTAFPDPWQGLFLMIAESWFLLIGKAAVIFSMMKPAITRPGFRQAK